METFQAWHSPQAERALKQGREWIASFVKTGQGQSQGASAMLFAGLYRNHGHRERSRVDIMADPEVKWLRETFGVFWEMKDERWDHWTWFDLTLDEKLAELQGRLLLSVRLTQTYVRLAENLDAPIMAIHERSTFDAGPPSWDEMLLRAGMLKALPPSWADRPGQWRGIYLIVDEKDGARYVGSAYGEENLFGRWRAHVSREKGVTKELAIRSPKSFRFSILELLSPTATPEEVTQKENRWMDRLHTRRFGLNAGGPPASDASPAPR